MQRAYDVNHVRWQRASRWSTIVILTMVLGSIDALLPMYSAAGAPRADSTPLPIDSTQVTLRLPAASQLDAFRRQRDFEYGEYVESRTPESILSIISRAFSRALHRLLGESGAATFWDIFPYAIMLGALVILVKLVHGDSGGIFRREARRRPVDLLGEGENVGEIDYAQRIAEAEGTAMWREAVRLQYLWTLRHLSDAGAIVWRVDKTNRDYVHEIADASRRSALQRAALLFEYVWYGEFPLKDEAYPRIRDAIVEARS